MSGQNKGKMQTLVNHHMRITLNDGRQMLGYMMAFDKHMNIVLADTEEFRKTKKAGSATAPGAAATQEEVKRTLGLTIIRGVNVVSASVEGPPPNEPAARLGGSTLPGGAAPAMAAGPGISRPAGRGMPSGLTGPAAGIGPGGFGGPPGGFPGSFPGAGGPPGFGRGGPPGGPPGFGGPPPDFQPPPGFQPPQGFQGGPPGAGRGFPPPGFGR